jgi:hypothetical protein
MLIDEVIMGDMYEFSSNRDINKALLQLKKYGITLIPNYLSSKKLITLNSEFEDSLHKPSESIFLNECHPTNTDGKVARLNPRHTKAGEEFPAIASVFQDSFMQEIADQYYSPYPYSFNETVFITNEFSSETQILPWHFDRVQSLKFWFNLTDTTVNNGAMEYCPGTHWEGRYRAGYHLSQGVGVEDVPNDIDDSLIHNPVSIELNAGDLMIFDADGFHRGGLVGQSGERRVLRAHTYPSGRRYGDKIFSPGWWVRSPLNINKWFGSSTSRVVGTRIQESTINRNKNNIT